MSTHARIGIERSDGTVAHIYCHLDGYLGGVGEVLMEHYTAPETIEELISLGDISDLGESTAPGWTSVYGRDYGDYADTQAIVSPSVQAMYDTYHNTPYLYVWADNRWLVSVLGEAFEPLVDAEEP